MNPLKILVAILTFLLEGAEAMGMAEAGVEPESKEES